MHHSDWLQQVVELIVWLSVCHSLVMLAFEYFFIIKELGILFLEYLASDLSLLWLLVSSGMDWRHELKVGEPQRWQSWRRCLFY